MHPRESAIAEVAGRQENVITRGQLLALGVGRRAIARRLENGRWQRIHSGVYLVGPAAPTQMARMRAAVLACGDGAAISHRTAALFWQVMPSTVREGDVHVTVAGRNPGQRPGICLHRATELAPSEVVTKAGLMLTSPARTIRKMALGGLEPPPDRL